MITICKQALKIKSEQLVMLQEGTEIISVGNQYNNLVIWYKCNTDNGLTGRKIYIRGTGHELSGDEKRFIGTVISDYLVRHVFEG